MLLRGGFHLSSSELQGALYTQGGVMSRLVLCRSYLSEGQGVRVWSSGKTERLRNVVVLPEG